MVSAENGKLGKIRGIRDVQKRIRLRLFPPTQGKTAPQEKQGGLSIRLTTIRSEFPNIFLLHFFFLFLHHQIVKLLKVTT